MLPERGSVLPSFPSLSWEGGCPSGSVSRLLRDETLAGRAHGVLVCVSAVPLFSVMSVPSSVLLWAHTHMSYVFGVPPDFANCVRVSAKAQVYTTASTMWLDAFHRSASFPLPHLRASAQSADGVLPGGRPYSPPMR